MLEFESHCGAGGLVDDCVAVSDSVIYFPRVICDVIRTECSVGISGVVEVFYLDGGPVWFSTRFFDSLEELLSMAYFQKLFFGFLKKPVARFCG